MKSIILLFSLFFFFAFNLFSVDLSQNLEIDSGVRLLKAEEEKVEISDVLSNGQFVYGPNVKGFNLKDFLDKRAPHLSPYYKHIYYRSLYYSVNPKVTLTLIDMTLINSFGDSHHSIDLLSFKQPEFEKWIDQLLENLIKAFYSKLNKSEYNNGATSSFKLNPEKMLTKMNAATYALASVLYTESMYTRKKFPALRTFRARYLDLFKKDDLLDDSNKIVPRASPPNSYFQFPYPIGESWTFNGVHSSEGAIDFSNGWPGWNSDTSNEWVVAAAPGTASIISACWVSVDHGSGWVTRYYHLENIQFTGSITVARDDKLAVYANTVSEALCSGGSSTGPHLHFSLIYNGAFYSLNGVDFSQWTVNAGRYDYDSDCNYMYLTKGSEKKCAYTDPIYNEGISATIATYSQNQWGVLIMMALISGTAIICFRKTKKA